MKLPWFKQKGILFVPATFIGWIILIVAFSYSVYVFRIIDSRSHSASDTLMNFAFNLLIIAAIYSFIAFLTSRNSKAEP